MPARNFLALELKLSGSQFNVTEFLNFLFSPVKKDFSAGAPFRGEKKKEGKREREQETPLANPVAESSIIDPGGR